MCVPPPPDWCLCVVSVVCILCVRSSSFGRCLLLRFYPCICFRIHVTPIMQQHVYAQTCIRILLKHTHKFLHVYLNSVCDSLPMSDVLPLSMHAGSQKRNDNYRILRCACCLALCTCMLGSSSNLYHIYLDLL